MVISLLMRVCARQLLLHIIITQFLAAQQRNLTTRGSEGELARKSVRLTPHPTLTELGLTGLG